MFSEVDWIPALTFVLITALSPGPNNLSSASMGVFYGYKRSVAYIVGIVSGILVTSTLAGLIADVVLQVFPAYETILRGVGALYILYLAYRTLQASYTNEEDRPEPMGFWDGFILQFLNIKVMLFSLTLYASYLYPIIDQFLPLVLTAAALAARAFLLNSLWSLFGESIRRWLRKPAVGKAFNTIIAFALAYNAADLAGIPALMRSLLD